MRQFIGDQLLIATHNKGKMEEIAALFGAVPFGLVSAAELGLAEPRETETTFAGNARLKAHAAAKASGMVALADDSGLCVDALSGDPGVYTADWAEGPNGRDFAKATARVCQMLAATGPSAPRSARFVCTLALAWPDGHDEIFEGVVEGRIVCPGRGDFGHGYDPIFAPEGSTLTFGEMDRWEKNLMSHRAVAFSRLMARFT